jgi:DNA-binding response OmpR family regulator
MQKVANSIGTRRTGMAVQKVAVVNGSSQRLHLLQSVIQGGHYDVIVNAETEHAYSQIKRTNPNLVILCVGVDDPLGLQVLSMLALDEETSAIPVLICANEVEGKDADTEPDADRGDEHESPFAPLRLAMN